MTVVPEILRPECSHCHSQATRYLPGKRRTFYCNQHGPSAVRDWPRLIPLPGVEPPPATARALAMLPPLPTSVAVAIDRLTEDLREAIATSTPPATADAEMVAQLQEENTRLREQLDRTTVELHNAEEIAYEAMEMMVPGEDAAAEPELPPTPVLPEPEPVVPKLVALSVDELRRTRKERKREQARQSGRGYTVTKAPPPPRTPEAKVVEAALPPQETGLPMVHTRGFGRTDVELFGLQVILQTIKPGPRTPGVAITRRAIKEYQALGTDDKLHVVALFEQLAQAPEAVRVAPHGTPSDRLYSARASRRLRVIFEKRSEKGRLWWDVLRFTDRGDKTEFSSER